MTAPERLEGELIERLRDWSRDVLDTPAGARHWMGKAADEIAALRREVERLREALEPEGWRLVPEEPTPEMIGAAEVALSAWRTTLTRDEALLRSYRAHDRKFIASASPAEKHAIRFRAMIAAAPSPVQNNRKDGSSQQNPAREGVER